MSCLMARLQSPFTLLFYPERNEMPMNVWILPAERSDENILWLIVLLEYFDNIRKSNVETLQMLTEEHRRTAGARVLES